MGLVYSIPGTQDTLILAASNPCNDPSEGGETMRGFLNQGQPDEKVVQGIVFCVSNFQASTKTTWRTVLPFGYDTGTFVIPGPNPDDYSSASGTILHEMVHFVDLNYCKFLG